MVDSKSDTTVDAGTVNAGKSLSDGREPEISFQSFVLSLATQALIQMGEVPAPDGVPLDQDLEAARHSISILEMLKIKTRGNLSAEEEKIIADVVHNVRVSYLRQK